jgi:hypothetical protein
MEDEAGTSGTECGSAVQIKGSDASIEFSAQSELITKAWKLHFLSITSTDERRLPVMKRLMIRRTPSKKLTISENLACVTPRKCSEQMV